MLGLGATAQHPDPIRVGAWNIEWLGDADFRSQPSKGVLQQPEALAAYIRESGVDILALEEISDNPHTEFDPDNPILARALALLSEGQAKPWKYILFPKKDERLTQLTGIAWNSQRVTAVDGPYKLALNDATPDGFQLWSRWPQAMKFQVAPGMTDFVLIPIHLKANRRDRARDNPPRQRAQEARALVSVLDEVRRRFADQDVILLGDTNCRRADEPALVSLGKAGYRDLNAADQITKWTGKAPYDRIFVPRSQPEFRLSRQTVHKPASLTPREFKIQCSDHYLVSTQFRAAADDD